jgi:hypothetical protein
MFSAEHYDLVEMDDIDDNANFELLSRKGYFMSPDKLSR